jgi:3-oxoacyl-[acyl-carrier-protein] synthase-3
MLAAKITGIGGFVPGKPVTNFDLEELLETSNDWIVQRTGIEQRFWANTDQATSDLALEAALIAIKNAGISKNEIDMIVLATTSPDSEVPGGAAQLQAKLGLPEIPYFDIRQACSGFVYGLSLADKFIRSGSNKCILVVGAEVLSKALDRTPSGKSVSVLFGDGAGAVIVQATEVENTKSGPQILSTALHADGSFAKELWIPAPGSAMGESRITHQMIDDKLIHPQMNGRVVFVNAVTRMPQVLNEALNFAKIEINDLDIIFFHQANLRINQNVAETMNLNPDKVHNTIHKFGNTTAATIPLGMYDAWQAGKLKSGMLVGISAFGAGFTWGAGIFRL